MIEMDALCVWASRQSECMWQTVNQAVMRGNRTVDRSISYFLQRRAEEKHCCSPGKWFAFHCSFISLILLVSLSLLFFSPSHPHSSLLCASLSPSPLWIWLFWLFISAHFSSCLSHREGGGDPDDQGWLMVYERSLWAMRALPGWIIYTGPGWEQTYVSQSHRRHTKASLSTQTETHTHREVKTSPYSDIMYQGMTSWRAKLSLSLLYQRTCRGKSRSMWPIKKTICFKAPFLVPPSCFLLPVHPESAHISSLNCWI